MDADEFYGFLLRGGRADGSPLSPSRVRRIHGVLRRAFTQAVNWGWVWVNPVSTASPPREPPAEVSPPTAEALRALLASVRDVDPPMFVFIHLGAASGARRSQLLGLRWGEIDFVHSAVGFTRAFVEGADGPVLRSTKNRRSYRLRSTQARLGCWWITGIDRSGRPNGVERS